MNSAGILAVGWDYEFEMTPCQKTTNVQTWLWSISTGVHADRESLQHLYNEEISNMKDLVFSVHAYSK